MAEPTYSVVAPLAEGGMGAIYLGKRVAPDGGEQTVVLKQLLPEHMRQPELVELFLREARLTAALDHPNIVRTLDLVHAGDTAFIVMEYVEGGDLRTLLKRAKRQKRRFAPAAALRLAEQVLAALDYAHHRRGPDGDPLGVVHRDVSPSNVLISKAGAVKLTDFGIAGASTSTSTFMRIKGKLGYMSPEQAVGEPLQPSSDVYSVAVCLYEMLTGERLHIATSVATSADALYSQPTPTLSDKVAGLPKGLDAIVKHALRVDPAERYQSAAQFAAALAGLGLSCTQPDLVRRLEEACGPAARWRNAQPSEDSGLHVEGDGEGTEKILLGSLAPEFEDDFEEELALEERAVPRLLSEHEASERFAALELTSLIDVKGRPRNTDAVTTRRRPNQKMRRPRRARWKPVLLIIVLTLLAGALGAASVLLRH